MTDSEQILLKLGEISGKLDAAIARADRTDKAIGSVEERVGALERGRAWLVGAGAAASMLLTLFVGSLADIFTKGP